MAPQSVLIEILLSPVLLVLVRGMPTVIPVFDAVRVTIIVRRISTIFEEGIRDFTVFEDKRINETEIS